MKGKEINWDEVKAGTYFKAKIEDIPCIGRIQKEHDWFYFCQNQMQGSTPQNRLGYNNGWTIAGGGADELADHNVTDLEISDEPFEGMIVPEAPVDVDINDSYHAVLTSDFMFVGDEGTSYETLLKIQSELPKHIAYYNELDKYLADEEYPEIKWDELESGTYFIAQIGYSYCVGRVQIEKNKVYLCQDVKDGGAPKDKLGYRFAWYITKDGRTLIGQDVENIKFYNEKPVLKLENGDIHLIGDLNGHASKFDKGLIHAGCQSFTMETVDKVIRLMDVIRAKEEKKLEK